MSKERETSKQIALEKTKQKKMEEVFKVPELTDHVVDLSIFAPEVAEIKAKALLEKEIPKLEEETKAALSWLEGVSKASREAREIAEYGVKKSGKTHPQQWLQKNLENEFQPYRRTTWMMLLKYYFSKEVKSREEVQELLQFLCREGYLQAKEGGPLKAYGEFYSPSEKAMNVLDQPEIRTLQRSLNGLLSRTWQAIKKAAKDQGQALLSRGKLSTKELLEGKAGQFAIEVPASREGRGGVLLVKSDGQRAFPLEAVGGFQKAIEEAKKLEVFLLLESLSKEYPPFIKGMEAERMAKVKLLWYLFKEGIAYQEERGKIQALRSEMASQVSLTPEEFFLQRKSGITLAEYTGPWRATSGEIQIENLFFLVERQEKEGQPIIQLVRIPPWLEEFFSNCRGEFSEGERFGRVPQPLQAVLQGIWGQVQKHYQIVNHPV